MGLHHQRNLKLRGVLRCNSPIPPIGATRIHFRHKKHDDPYENIHAMRQIDHAIHQNKIMKKTFAFGNVKQPIAKLAIAYKLA